MLASPPGQAGSPYIAVGGRIDLSVRHFDPVAAWMSADRFWARVSAIKVTIFSRSTSSGAEQSRT